jgi:hypothetical protein
MHLEEKEIGATSSSRETVIDADHDDDASISTDSHSSVEDIRSIHRTLSRNAGYDERDKNLAKVNTTATNMTSDPQFEIDFEDGENPQDMSMARKAMTIAFMSFSTLVVSFVLALFSV